MSYDEFFGEQNAFDFAAPNPGQALKQKIAGFFVKKEQKGKNKVAPSGIQNSPKDLQGQTRNLIHIETSHFKVQLEKKILKTLQEIEKIQNILSGFRLKDVLNFKKWKKTHFKKHEAESQKLHLELENVHDQLFKIRSKSSSQKDSFEFFQNFQSSQNSSESQSSSIEEIQVWADNKSQTLEKYLIDHSGFISGRSDFIEDLLAYLDKEGCLGIPFHFDQTLAISELSKCLEKLLFKNESQSQTPDQAAKVLFKKLAVRLHPDRNPEFNSKTKQLWSELQQKKGDLSGLQVIESKYLLIVEKQGNAISENLLKQVLENEKRILGDLKKEFSVIKNQIEFGFNSMSPKEKKALKTQITKKFATEKRELKNLLKTALSELKKLGQLSET